MCPMDQGVRVLLKVTHAKKVKPYAPGHLPQHHQPWGLLLKPLPSPQMRQGQAWCLNHKPAKKAEKELERRWNYEWTPYSQNWAYSVSSALDHKSSIGRYHRNNRVCYSMTNTKSLFFSTLNIQVNDIAG